MADRLGPQIQFVERAFEWENMIYQFSSYFYGRFGEWQRRIVEFGDPDPDFSAFLRAGAAHVMVPARPEFAEALIEFDRTGTFPSGYEALLTAEDAIDAMIEELRARGADSVPDAVPEGDPWEVKLPTSLVLLQDPEDITFRDALYGDANTEKTVGFDLPDLPETHGGGG